MVSRRKFIKGAGAVALAGGLSMPGLSFASLPTDKRFVLVILRGGMDGLMAVPPFGDDHYRENRKKFVTLPMPGQEMGIVDIDGFFGLHPSLEPLKKYYDRKEFAILPAVASPYRGHSHFDAQKLLELGTKTIDKTKDGWLNRMLRIYGHDAKIGLAVGQQLPLVLQGDIRVGSWFPEGAKTKDNHDYFEKVKELFAGNELFEEPFLEALRVEKMAAMTAHAMYGDNMKMIPEDDIDTSHVPFLVRPTLPPESMKIFGSMLAKADGPRIAVMESGGWDTHARQGTEVGALANRLSGLAITLDTLAESLGDVWKKTVVVVVTEFGRQVEENGSMGTDHGTGSAAFVLGGAIKGGQILGKWPGLAPENLYNVRDLMPTQDMRGIFKTVLHKHLGLEIADIKRDIFPDSDDVGIIEGLIS